jgi:pimeloyl-ACP methyl ester carboxylesterase
MNTDFHEIEFKSADGTKLFGTLTEAQKNLTGLALFVHGITADRDEWGLFERLAFELSKAGILSLRFDYRAHGKSDASEDQFLLSRISEDIEAACEILSLQSTDRSLPMFIFGSSFGGGLAYFTASKLNRFTRAFLFAPVLDYAEDIRNSAPDWKNDLEQRGYVKYSSLRMNRTMLEEAEQFDPFTNGDHLSAIIYHGDQDDDVPLTSSNQATKTHSNVSLRVVEGAGHVLVAGDDIDMETEETWKLVDDVISQILEQIQDDIK